MDYLPALAFISFSALWGLSILTSGTLHCVSYIQSINKALGLYLREAFIKDGLLFKELSSYKIRKAE